MKAKSLVKPPNFFFFDPSQFLKLYFFYCYISINLIFLILFYCQAQIEALDSPCRDLWDRLFYTLFPSATDFMFVVSGLVGPAEPVGLCVAVFFASLSRRLGTIGV